MTWVQPGEILLHIGPHKTGTTALQAAFAQARPALRDMGVFYPGEGNSHWHAAAAALDRRTGGGEVPQARLWSQLLAEVAADDGRALLSSEFFCEADDRTAAQVVADLGRPVRVVLTLRALDRLLPSTWQQAVKTAVMPSYERWLHRVLDRPRRAVVWRRFDTVALVERWARVVGTDHVCAVVLEEGNPATLLSAFADLLGIQEDVLKLPAVSNRSMTAAEAEAVRRIYGRLGDALSQNRRQRWLRRGALLAMVEGYRPEPDEARIRTPAWAVDRARELQAELNRGLMASGVRVIGDPDALLAGPGPGDEEERAWPDRLPHAAVAELVVGALLAADQDVTRLERRLEHSQRRLRQSLQEVMAARADLKGAGMRAMLGELTRRASPRRRRSY